MLTQTLIDHLPQQVVAGLENRRMIEVVPPAMEREDEDWLKGAQTSMMSDPEFRRARNRFAADHALIRSLCAVGWAPASSAL